MTAVRIIFLWNDIIYVYKRFKMKRYLICLIGLLLAGCTAGPVEDMPETAQLVTISFGKPDLGVPELLTRAEESAEAAPTPLPVGSTVRIGAYYTGSVEDTPQEAVFSTTAPTFEATYVVGADGSLSPCCVNEAGAEVPGDAKQLTVRGGVYDFYAVSPARSLQQDVDGVYKITGIPHKEDVMTSFVRGVLVTTNARQVTLGTFRRKCAMVVFNVAPSKDNALPFEKLYGTKLLVSRISSSGASLTAGSDTGIPATGGGSGADAQVEFDTDEFVPVEADSDPNDSGLNKTKGVILPKNGEPFDVEIAVVKDNETATLKATIDRNISFDEGKRYVFTLEVKNNESNLLLKVITWNAIAFQDDNVGGPDGGSYPDPDINEGIGTTITVASWNNIQWSGNGEIGKGDN